MGTLLSSKVNQWTLLVGMLPLVYMISAGQIMPMHMDERQMEEVLLTAAQSLFAVVILANLRFSLLEALALFLLFGTQLMIPDPRFRMYYSLFYIALAAALVLLSRENRNGLWDLFKRG
jgi:cation:H+ antiporter